MHPISMIFRELEYFKLHLKNAVFFNGFMYSFCYLQEKCSNLFGMKRNLSYGKNFYDELCYIVSEIA